MENYRPWRMVEESGGTWAIVDSRGAMIAENIQREDSARELLGASLREESSDDVPIQTKYGNLYHAVLQHYNTRGNDRCWENDCELYKAIGLNLSDPELPPIDEHRRNCDIYRARLYGVSIEGEPYAQSNKKTHKLGYLCIALTIVVSILLGMGMGYLLATMI